MQPCWHLCHSRKRCTESGTSYIAECAPRQLGQLKHTGLIRRTLIIKKLFSPAQVLWPKLLHFVVPAVYTPTLTPLCRCLKELAGLQEKEMSLFLGSCKGGLLVTPWFACLREAIALRGDYCFLQRLPGISSASFQELISPWEEGMLLRPVPQTVAWGLGREWCPRHFLIRRQGSKGLFHAGLITFSQMNGPCQSFSCNTNLLTM